MKKRRTVSRRTRCNQKIRSGDRDSGLTAFPGQFSRPLPDFLRCRQRLELPLEGRKIFPFPLPAGSIPELQKHQVAEHSDSVFDGDSNLAANGFVPFEPKSLDPCGGVDEND